MPAKIDSGLCGAARSVTPTGTGRDPRRNSGILSSGAIYLAGPVSAAPGRLSPNQRPFPLEQVGEPIRKMIFDVAAACFLKATSKKAQGLSDADALRAANATPETTEKAHNEAVEKDIAELRRSHKKALSKAKTQEERAALTRGQNEVEKLIRTKLKQGRALVNSKPPRILISPALFAAAKAGKSIPNVGSARMLYRLTFLEEQAHIYLHLRGIDISAEINRDLDELLAGAAGGSCHHNAIPIAKRHYLAKYKSTLGNVYLNRAKID